MTRRGRLRDELRRLRTGPVTVLDPMRAQQLEHRVMGATGPRQLELVDSESIGTPRSNRRLAAVVTLAAACVLAVVLIASLDPAGPSERILSTSGDVEVVLPNGSVVDGSNGMVLPDGAIVRLGRDGTAEVDGMTISGAGDYLVTPDGLTLVRKSSRSGSTSPSTPGEEMPSTIAAEAPVVASAPRSTEPGPATTVVRPTTTERAAPTTAVRPTTTERGRATTVVPLTTTARRVVPPPADASEPRRTAPASPTTTSAPAAIGPPSGTEPSSNDLAPLDVTIRSHERGVVFAWRAVGGAAGYEVAAVPAVADGESSWPPAPGVEITELPAGTLQVSVERPTDGAWSYRIAAVARDGRTLALSGVFTIES